MAAVIARATYAMKLLLAPKDFGVDDTDGDSDVEETEGATAQEVQHATYTCE